MQSSLGRRPDTDVTAQKRAEAEVVAKTARLEEALENMGDGISVFDRDLNILLHNRQMRAHFGLPSDPNEQAQRLINGLRNSDAGVSEL